MADAERPRNPYGDVVIMEKRTRMCKCCNRLYREEQTLPGFEHIHNGSDTCYACIIEKEFDPHSKYYLEELAKYGSESMARLRKTYEILDREGKKGLNSN